MEPFIPEAGPSRTRSSHSCSRMQDAWEIYAQGADEIPVFYLDGVSDLLGEVHPI